MKLDLMNDPLPRSRFDLICTAMTLHHIGDTGAILRTFAELLARLGYLCIADLDTEDGSFHGAGFDGHNGFDRSALASEASRAGLRVDRFVTAYTMQKAVGSAMHAYPIFLMIARKCDTA